ncbi:ABC transporter permease [Chromobacterium phragmitis]|uniref:ABC transporter permease n=2 Tax=Chromobacterium phragmitis TaxID=2202141 RepID=A0A344UNE8_9NEIS|nr:ABC transporter permease [Chromobacterium phragmitis]AXE36796.1 ABC transporter permease [Chromobacterium phragmitis]
MPMKQTTALLGLRAGLFISVLAAWWWLTASEILPPFFFGEPAKVAQQLYDWFASGSVFAHLGVTLLETFLALLIGSVAGAGMGLWLALSPLSALLLDPYIKAANAMPRVVLAPIFAVWFGLGMASKVALGFTLVFFVVFFNVYQGVREVDPRLLANTRMLGASRRQLMRHVYLPSAAGWLFSSMHNAVGMAFVGAVVGEYLGSAQGMGYLILQAEGAFDINAVIAGIVVLTGCALGLDWLVGRAERRVLHWHPSAKAGA